MNPWLLAQIAFAAVAWYLAAKAVLRASVFGGYSGKELARTIRSLRRLGRTADLPRLADLLAPSPLEPLLRLDLTSTNAQHLVATADDVLDEVRPPDRLLRGMATIGTTLGLLAAVTTMRQALGADSAGGMEHAASRAFDSAVAGFVTALPCWTASALCRQRLRETYREIDLVILALSSGPNDDEAAGEGDPPSPRGPTAE